MSKVSLMVSLLVILLVGGFLLSSRQKLPDVIADQFKISTSFYPLYFFSSQIAGDQALVLNLTKGGVEAHDFEPSINDLRAISASHLLVVNGLGFEPWLEKFAGQLDDEIQILATAENLAELESTDEAGQKDHHVWLDPILAKEQVKLIASKIIALDEANTDFYRDNEQKLLTELDQLDLEFSQGSANCQQKNVITAHAAFAYLAKRYGFKQIAIQGLTPEEEPSSAKLAEVSRLAKELEIKYIFFENLLSPKLAETIANEAGAGTLIFHPLENLAPAEEAAGANYFSVQRQNLANLRQAMDCQ